MTSIVMLICSWLYFKVVCLGINVVNALPSIHDKELLKIWSIKLWSFKLWSFESIGFLWLLKSYSQFEDVPDALSCVLFVFRLKMWWIFECLSDSTLPALHWWILFLWLADVINLSLSLSCLQYQESFNAIKFVLVWITLQYVVNFWSSAYSVRKQRSRRFTCQAEL